MAWLLTQSILTIALIVLGIFYVLAGLAIGLVAGLMRLGLAGTFEGVYPQSIGPIGAVFALLTAFLAAEVWPGFQKARDAVDDEAVSLGQLVVLADALPPNEREEIRTAVRTHVDRVVFEEWPGMAMRRRFFERDLPLANLFLKLLREEQASNGDEKMSVRTVALRVISKALDAARERIIISQRTVGATKVVVVVVLAFLEMVMLSVVHAKRRRPQFISVYTFATAAALSIFIILIYDQPFARGGFVVSPSPLLVVRPD